MNVRAFYSRRLVQVSLLVILSTLCQITRGQAPLIDQPSTNAGSSKARATQSLPKCHDELVKHIEFLKLRVLRNKVGTLKEQYLRTEALYRTGRRGGELEKHALAGIALTSALADLTWAEKDVLATVRYRARAVKFARLGVEAGEAAYDADKLPLDKLLNFFNQQADQELAMLRVIKFASCSGIDISDVELPEPLVMDLSASDQPLDDSFRHPD